ncbi:MAG: histidine phosphatase family protein [bacterium]
MTRRIFIMRHAMPQNPTDVIYGNLPGFPLSDLGKAQAREAGEFMESIKLDFVYTSPRERAEETGQIVAMLNLGHPQIIVDPRLRDLGLGKYQGKIAYNQWHEQRQKYLAQQEIGDGEFESPVSVQSRMREAITRAIQKHPDASLLFVSHGDPIDYVLQWVERGQLKGLAQYSVHKASIWELDFIHHRVSNIFQATIKLPR